MDAHMEIVNHCHCVSVCVCLCVDVRKGKSRRRGRVSVFSAYARVGESKFQQKA